MQTFVFRVVFRTFQNNTLTLNKNNDCEMHKKAFEASNIGAANSFSCFGFCFWTDLWMCVFEFEIFKIVFPTLVLFPENVH